MPQLSPTNGLLMFIFVFFAYLLFIIMAHYCYIPYIKSSFPGNNKKNNKTKFLLFF